MNDLREELRRTARPTAMQTWKSARADFADMARYWERPLGDKLKALCGATEEAFESDWIWQALGDGWRS